MSLELIASVSNNDMLQAAVQTGADAMCLMAPCGAVKETFSRDELIDAVKTCRLRGVRAYVYFASLLLDSELPALKTLVDALNACGADAIVASDLGLIRMVRTAAPDMAVFGGEEMAVHDLAGVMAAQKLGLSRVWLARELTLDEIRFIRERTEMQLQVSCHGNQCVSYSGQCYMSSFVASRSANRGQCMDSCRVAYSYFGDSPGEHLSLKDMCLGAYVGTLDSMGINGAYIDGKEKRGEYTALVTDMYRKTINNGSLPARSDIMRLESLYARDGFSAGYIKGEIGADMFGMANRAADRDARKMYAEARKMYQGENDAPTVPVDMYFCAHAGKEMTLVCRDRDGNETAARSPAVSAARKGTVRSDISSWLRKTEKTAFKVEKCSVDIDEGLRITPAAVAAMRKSCLESMTLRRKSAPSRPVGQWQPGLKRLGFRGKPAMALSFLRTDQISTEILDTEPEIVYLPVWCMHEDTKIIELLRGRGIIPCAVLDRIVSDKEWPDLLLALRSLKDAGLEHILCQNIGQAMLLKPLGFIMRGDFGMNVLNSQSIKELKAQSLDCCTLSFEMSFAQMRELSMSMDCELIVYGRLPLMITKNCIIHKNNGVHACHNGGSALIDKTGRSYPLLPEKGCRNTLYNSEKLWLADKTEDYEKLGLRNVRLCFTTENSKECFKAVQAYLGKADITPERATRGMYYRGSL